MNEKSAVSDYSKLDSAALTWYWIKGLADVAKELNNTINFI